MTLEDMIEARLAGRDPEIPPDLKERHRPALTAHDALTFAVGETIGWPADYRHPPELPADYEILGEVGRGGMGVVYLARQKALGREVAVKVLRLGPDTRDRLVRRFLDEARHMAQLRHPNIVAVHEVGRAEGEPYFTMDYVPGESLAARLAGGPLTPARAVAVLKQVCAAVQHAHEQGIIHRDLKPGNVLIDDSGHAYVTDFGLARDVSASSDLTRPGELLGTPAYMAPEQARGQTDLIGEATDVHAIGAILYETLTGRPPYGSDAPAAVFARLLSTDPTSPRAIDRRIPRDLETICLKCLEKDPAKRYPTARAVLEDLRRFEVGEPITARRPSLLARAARVARRQWKLVATAVLTAALAVGGAALLLDKSVSELRDWGREREAAGDHAGAVDVYRRAWQKATGTEKDAIKEDLIRCARATSDEKAALAAANDVIQVDPYASFGKHDHLVAQSVVADLKARTGGSVAAASLEKDRALLELAERRLRVFQNSGGGTAAERKDAEQTLAATVHVLAGRPHGQPEPIEDTPPDFQLPDGSPEQLRRLMADEAAHPSKRARAAFVLARKAKDAGRKDEAREASARAFELLRSVYPMYSGVAESTVISPVSDDRIGREASEAVLLRQVHDLARELNPDRPSALRGGIRFTIAGVDLPADQAVSINAVLTGPGVKESSSYLPHRTVPFVRNGAAVGVADGTYALRLEGRSVSIPPGGERFVRFLEFDLDQAPKTVTVAGKFIEIKIPARTLAEVALIGPDPGAAHDPTTEFLRWGEVPGAAYYRVKLNLEQDAKDSRSIEGLPDVVVKTTRVCLGTLDDSGAAVRARKLQPRRLVTWSVEAYDAKDRRIAVSLEYGRPLVLTRGIGP